MPSRHHHPELVALLADGVANLTTTENWRRHLEAQGRFHRYSFNNVLLLMAQRPDASRVAGFSTWRRLGRQVRTGERALWILAPMVRRRRPAGTADADADADWGPEEDRGGGGPVGRGGGDGDDGRVVRGFRYVPVFDITQTEGDDLPTVCDRLEGDDPAGRFDTLVGVAGSIGYRVEDHGFGGSVNGDCSHVLRRIRVECSVAPRQRVKTLAHELAHALLHEQADDRALAELEAESTAFVVCRALGIDSGRYSFGYVAVWSGGGEQAVSGIRASGERIQRCAATILERCGDGSTVAPRVA